MLSVENLTLQYGASQILHGVSLTARPGAVTAVMGTNGVGKTSLLKAIAGRHPYSGGRITLDGVVLDHLSAAQAARAGIGYVPQGREVFPLLTVTENLETGFACLPKSEHRIPPRIYDLFPVLEQMKDRRGGDLSGG
ncbi:MAG: ATP-binding cassette domain-containing protein, partial [Roseovarius sp.]|nr:ATP-binding cassette domain-containing protein [Roseovarius sp.]